MLEIRQLAWRPGGQRTGPLLAQGLSAFVRPGERWAVLGPNGAGKSTLMAILAGLLPVLVGQVLLDGRPLGAWTLTELASRRAWCGAGWTDPFPATVLETLQLAALGPAQAGYDEASLLARLELSGLVHRDVRQLSAGERQRVALACAMRQGAPLLLLDEPTAHLDLAHQQDMAAELTRWTLAGGAVIATLHDIDLAATWATHAVVLLPGARVLAGPVAHTLIPAVLSEAFGVAVQDVEVCGEHRLWIGPRVPRAARAAQPGGGRAL